MTGIRDQPRLTAEILEFLQYFNYQAERGLLAMNLFRYLPLCIM